MGRRKADNPIDWPAIERHYRANQLSLNEIAKQYEVTRQAISKRAENEGWVRDLAEKIEQETKSKVMVAIAKREIAGNLPPGIKLAERQLQAINSDVGATIDLQGRDDVARALGVQRSLLQELEQLTRPEFAERLEWLGKVMDESGPTPSGGWKTDKINELYQYVISLGGRIKMAKELGAAHGVYLPLQRKMFKLDEGKSQAPFEDLLARLGSAQQESS